MSVIIKTDELTIEQRIERIDTLLCILFSGLVANPLAPNLIPYQELEMLKAMLPKDIPEQNSFGPDGEA